MNWDAFILPSGDNYIYAMRIPKYSKQLTLELFLSWNDEIISDFYFLLSFQVLNTFADSTYYFPTKKTEE